MTRKVVEVTLSDGTVVLVHAPGAGDMGIYLRALPSLLAIQRSFTAIQSSAQGVIGMPVDLPDSSIEQIYPLMAVMCDMTVEQFKALPTVFDAFAVFQTMALFVPNQQAATSPQTQLTNQELQTQSQSVS